MGQEKIPNKVMLIITSFSKDEEVLNFFEKEAQKKFGKIILKSPLFDFNETRFYEKEMGSDLKLQILGFEKLIAPEKIAKIKHYTNKLEKKIHNKYKNKHGEISRIINLDPGYISLIKFVLATTKDAGHRIYIGNKIYGEATLSYENKSWKEHSYTYANYKNKEYQEFLTKLREEYKKLIK